MTHAIRVTIEFDDGRTVIAEGAAIQEFSLDRRFEIGPVRDESVLREPPQMAHTGAREVHVSLKAVCRYRVTPNVLP